MDQEEEASCSVGSIKRPRAPLACYAEFVGIRVQVVRLITWSLILLNVYQSPSTLANVLKEFFLHAQHTT